MKLHLLENTEETYAGIKYERFNKELIVPFNDGKLELNQRKEIKSDKETLYACINIAEHNKLHRIAFYKFDVDGIEHFDGDIFLDELIEE